MKSVLAQRLRAARQALYPAITQREVAKRMKVSPSAVNLWESGKTQPSAETLAALSRWFGVTSDWLLGVEEGHRPTKASTTLPPLHTVPVVTPDALARWQLNLPTELLQTAIAYPPGTAAAMLVASDALTSTCPTGCYAVVSKGDSARPGQVVLAKVSRAGEPVLRKFVREAGDDMLVADDTRYPTFRMDDGVKVIGRVTEVTVRRILS